MAFFISDFDDVESQVAYCLNPGAISNGRIAYYPDINSRRRVGPELEELEDAEFPEESRLEYSCNSGYSLQGRTRIVCEKTGFWSSEPPICRRGKM